MTWPYLLICLRKVKRLQAMTFTIVTYLLVVRTLTLTLTSKEYANVTHPVQSFPLTGPLIVAAKVETPWGGLAI